MSTDNSNYIRNLLMYTFPIDSVMLIMSASCFFCAFTTTEKKREIHKRSAGVTKNITKALKKWENRFFVSIILSNQKKGGRSDGILILIL